MRACRRGSSAGLAFAGAASILLHAQAARASNVTEFPDNGSEQLARGGAWVARASDPLATFFNPAGLAGQDTKLTLQASAIVHHTCFTRVKAAGDTSTEPLAAGSGGAFPRVCNDVEVNPNPQLAGTLRISDRLGVGLALLGPSAAGESNWPDFVNDQASPNRYMLLRRHGVLAFPSLGVGFEVIPGLRLGASFQWGFADLKLASASVALNVDSATPVNDVRTNLQLKDYFIPGGTFGALYSPNERLDLAAWYRVSDSVRASGDLGTAANYFTPANARGDASRIIYGDTFFGDCGTGNKAVEGTCGPGKAAVTLAIPMEAKLGVRYHAPLAGGPSRKGHRDPMADDLFDAELDLTWANNSAIDSIQVRFPSDAKTGDAIIPVSGIPGGGIPGNADQKRGYRDVIGVRLGGDFNVIRDRLALRGGGFFESSAQDKQYQNIDFAAASRLGLALGATFHVR
ncbi:MAG TPA: outer membrane protein transport protein, partial [Polyangiaceae bacterium]|nr:outer membrane protein transport protein [Polyangiaceae bacterium]